MPHWGLATHFQALRASSDPSGATSGCWLGHLVLPERAAPAGWPLIPFLPGVTRSYQKVPPGPTQEWNWSVYVNVTSTPKFSSFWGMFFFHYHLVYLHKNARQTPSPRRTAALRLPSLLSITWWAAQDGKLKQYLGEYLVLLTFIRENVIQIESTGRRLT